MKSNFRWQLDLSTEDLAWPIDWWRGWKRSRMGRTVILLTSLSGDDDDDEMMLLSIMSWFALQEYCICNRLCWWLTEEIFQGEQQDCHQLLPKAWLHRVQNCPPVLQRGQWWGCVSTILVARLTRHLNCNIIPSAGMTCGRHWPWM